MELILLGCFLLLFGTFCLTKLKLDGRLVWSGWDRAESNFVETEEVSAKEQVLREQEAYRQKMGGSGEQAQTGTNGLPQTEASGAGSQTAAGSGDQTRVSSEEAMIRVLIKTTDYAGYYHDRIVLKGNSPLHLNGDSYVAGAGEAVEITRDCAWFQDGCITVRPEDGQAGTAVENLERAQGTPVYEGTFEVYQGSNGIVLVNELPLETYLKYVVPSEMPASYAQEALKAQAVCARTYAWRQMLNNSLSDYHAQVDDSVSYQVYNNTTRQDSTDQAVDATAGQILTCDGEPITAYFFSTSSGYTSTDEVWDSSAGEAYLESVYLGEDEAPDISTEEAFASFITSRDENSYEAEDGWYRWQVTLPMDYLNSRIAGYGIGTLNSLEIVQRSTGGAVETLTIHGTSGSKTLTSEYDIREVFSTKGYPIEKNDGKTTTQMSLMPSAYFICSPVTENGAVTGYRFQGGGYGHGVGMSQNGAARMAQRGKTYEEILHFFYSDVELTDI